MRKFMKSDSLEPWKSLDHAAKILFQLFCNGSQTWIALQTKLKEKLLSSFLAMFSINYSFLSQETPQYWDKISRLSLYACIYPTHSMVYFRRSFSAKSKFTFFSYIYSLKMEQIHSVKTMKGTVCFTKPQKMALMMFWKYCLNIEVEIGMNLISGRIQFNLPSLPSIFGTSVIFLKVMIMWKAIFHTLNKIIRLLQRLEKIVKNTPKTVASEKLIPRVRCNNVDIYLCLAGHDNSSYLSVADVLNKPRNDGNNCLHLAVKNGHEKVKWWNKWYFKKRIVVLEVRIGSILL